MNLKSILLSYSAKNQLFLSQVELWEIKFVLNVHTQPGDEVICEADAHIFQYESGSPAVLSGLQLYPVKGENGIIDPESVKTIGKTNKCILYAKIKSIGS